MTVAAPTGQSGRLQLVALGGTALTVGVTLFKLDFFLRPGFTDVLSGLGHHAFVLAWLLILTARSRTVSLPTLALFWLTGVWGVYGLAYLLEEPMGRQFGAGASDKFVPVWWAPFVEEALKLPVALYLVLAARGGRRQPAMTDGLLLGFMVGAGVAFHEDAHVARIFVSGDGWGEATPWTAIFPTITPAADIFALNHALWAGLSGLAFGVALMFRHRPWAWAIALVGPLLGLTNHMMANHFLSNESGVLGLLGRGDVPWIFSTIKDLTGGGRVPMFVLITGAVGAAIAEWRILRWVSMRDQVFSPLPAGHVVGLVPKANSLTGLKQLVTAERYNLLRRTVYFAAWRTRRAGGYPDVSEADFAELLSLRARAVAPPAAGPVTPAPALEIPAVGAAGTPLPRALEDSPPASGAAVPGAPLIPADGDDRAIT